jgi:hypothetical protein
LVSTAAAMCSLETVPEPMAAAMYPPEPVSEPTVAAM